MTRPFSELREKMSPEARDRSRKKTEEMLMGWIDVKERLPEIGVTVLAHSPSMPCGPSAVHDYHLTRITATGRWCYGASKLYPATVGGISHWQPLPAPPEVAKGYARGGRKGNEGEVKL